MVAAIHEQPEIAQQLATGTIQVYIQWKINANREGSAAPLGFVDELAATHRTSAKNAAVLMGPQLVTWGLTL